MTQRKTKINKKSDKCVNTVFFILSFTAKRGESGKRLAFKWNFVYTRVSLRRSLAEHSLQKKPRIWFYVASKLARTTSAQFDTLFFSVSKNDTLLIVRASSLKKIEMNLDRLRKRVRQYIDQVTIMIYFWVSVLLANVNASLGANLASMVTNLNTQDLSPDQPSSKQQQNCASEWLLSCLCVCVCSQQQYQSALFWADKIASLSHGEWVDVN